MENIPRGSDGRRLFTPEFKREQVGRLVRGELTLTELSRELGISRSVLQRWKHLITQGGETAVAANEDVVPASELRAAQQKIRELVSHEIGVRALAANPLPLKSADRRVRNTEGNSPHAPQQEARGTINGTRGAITSHLTGSAASQKETAALSV